MNYRMKPNPNDFRVRAEQIRNLDIAIPVGSIGGYGPNGEVIYLRQPAAAPAVLIDTRDNVKATFAANGSVAFVVTRPEGWEIPVLSGSFDIFEKREMGTLSGNVWLDLTDRSGKGKGLSRIVSLVNPSLEVNLPAKSRKIVKLERPVREIFYCADVDAGEGVAFTSVLRMSLVVTPAGPAILRQVYLRNTGRKAITGNLWGFFNLHGTQKRVYDKEIWYDMGLPLSPAETVSSCTVPYTDIVQVKRVSSAVTPGFKPVAATCSYLSFVGDSGQFSLLPEAVKRGELSEAKKYGGFNRFTAPTIAANQFSVNLPAGKSACLEQSLLYVANEAIVGKFRTDSSAPKPGFVAAKARYLQAAKQLTRRTPDVAAIAAVKPASEEGIARYFHVELPTQQGEAEFINSVWASMPDMYGRNYGGKIADGVELPFRDRCQDLRPVIALFPGRVREDLVHAAGFMYQTSETPISTKKRLTLLEKLHGCYPRQIASLWLDRRGAIFNDNRPFADSAIWLVETIIRYVRETGDVSILLEEATTVEFADVANPISIRGGKKRQTIIEAMLQILAMYERLCTDSPYGMVQILYGDWADPVDLFGTDRIGDATRRGYGRGVSVRLSAHVFVVALQAIDALGIPAVAETVAGALPLDEAVEALKAFANRLRSSTIKYAWEDARGKKAGAGFIDSIHELKKDGKAPKLAKGEIGYTLGSMNPKREFDGVPRRVLTTMAYGLRMLTAEREYLKPLPDRQAKIKALLKTVDELAYQKDVGLKLYTTALANSTTTLRYVGRMGLLPTGCAENGEYHHAQSFMHRFRLDVPGQADRTWSQFREILSVTRDGKLMGPFDSLTNSYASDPSDPYFGAGMIFGLSGTADLAIETAEKIVGIDLDLVDERRANLRITPTLPKHFEQTLSFQRVIHQCVSKGKYREIPLHVNIRKAGRGETAGVSINGRAAAKAEIANVSGFKKIDVEIRM